MTQDAPKPLLTRKQAAGYLTANWFSCSKFALDRYATLEVGPPYRRRGPNGKGGSYYTKEDLDRWAEWFLLPPEQKGTPPVREE